MPENIAYVIHDSSRYLRDPINVTTKKTYRLQENFKYCTMALFKIQTLVYVPLHSSNRYIIILERTSIKNQNLRYSNISNIGILLSLRPYTSIFYVVKQIYVIHSQNHARNILWRKTAVTAISSQRDLDCSATEKKKKNNISKHIRFEWL